MLRGTHRMRGDPADPIAVDGHHDAHGSTVDDPGPRTHPEKGCGGGCWPTTPGVPCRSSRKRSALGTTTTATGRHATAAPRCFGHRTGTASSTGCTAGSFRRPLRPACRRGDVPAAPLTHNRPSPADGPAEAGRLVLIPARRKAPRRRASLVPGVSAHERNTVLLASKLQPAKPEF